MDKLMFSCDFPNLACCLHTLAQSLNNNKRPNKKNDVITDLGGEGDFPMFLFTGHISPLSHLARLTRLSHLVTCTAWPQSKSETESSAGLLSHE